MPTKESFSAAATDTWKKLNRIKIKNPFKIRRSEKKEDEPKYWKPGTANRIKEYTGWDF